MSRPSENATHTHNTIRTQTDRETHTQIQTPTHSRHTSPGHLEREHQRGFWSSTSPVLHQCRRSLSDSFPLKVIKLISRCQFLGCSIKTFNTGNTSNTCNGSNASNASKTSAYVSRFLRNSVLFGLIERDIRTVSNW